MALNYNAVNSVSGCQSAQCVDPYGCPQDRCPDFVIRRHDTKPPLQIAVEDCDGPLNLEGLVVEVNMWAKGKLKAAITPTDTYFALANNVGFNQIMLGDIIVMDRVRQPEYMLVTGFDEDNSFVQVERGYHNTPISKWKKGSCLRIFRAMNSPAKSEMVFEDQTTPDGVVTKDVLTSSLLIYEWLPEDTCLPGCYWLEFKVLKMINAVYFLPGGYWTGVVHEYTDGFFYTGSTHTDSSVKVSYDAVQNHYILPDNAWSGQTHSSSGNYFTGSTADDGSVFLTLTGLPLDGTSLTAGEAVTLNAMSVTSITPSFTSPSLTATDYGCILGTGVEWVRRFPMAGEGFLIKIIDSPTKEF